MAWIEDHRGRWRVSWREDKRKRSRTFADRLDAETFLDEVQTVHQRNRELRRQRKAAYLTVSDVVDTYYERRKRHLQPSTQHHYEQIISKHIRSKIGMLSARDTADDPSPLQDFYDDLPPTTALHAHQILRPAFQHAVDHRRLERNPCSIVKPPRRRRPEKLIPKSDEVAKIVLAARERNDAFGLFIWLVSRLGLRRGEACALRWDDFDPASREIHVRRTIARQTGGSFIKLPKSGETRTLRMDPRFFKQLLPDLKASGWLFPRGYNAPYRDQRGIAPHSTAGRFLSSLAAAGGPLRSEHGRAGIQAARILGLGKHSAGPMLRRLNREGLIDRVGNSSRTYEISLTEKGRKAIEAWGDTPSDGLPWFPTTADEKFAELMRNLDMPYTLHSLRHFVATHLYNRNRDWVQLARFLGHSSPAVTMNLYANHVVEASQLALAEAAMDLFDDPLLDPGDPIRMIK